jgi:acyl-homoserine lactone synthase
MIYAVTPADRAAYAPLLDQQFQIRHAIFVREMGWHDFERPNNYEMDDYDNEYAIYILATEAERVIGGFRLYPTTRPHMLTTAFPHLLEEKPLTGSDILEWTRVFIVKDKRDTGTWYALGAALHEFCLATNINTVTAAIRMARLPIFLKAGFAIRPLGLPQEIDGEPTLAVRVDILRGALSQLRKAGNLRGPVISNLITDAKEAVTLH